MMYAAKQLVGALATPLVLALAILLLAALCWVLGRRRSGTWLAASAVVISYFAAIPPVADALLSPLETRYPPLNTQLAPAVQYVVVLGSSYTPRDGVPITGALGPDGLARIVEGVRLVRTFPAARLVVSGGAVAGGAASAEGYARLARELGIESERIVIITAPLDTNSEAVAVAAMLGSTQFLLVTSASHMPRAMRLMSAAGARPMAAPTAHRVDASRRWSWRSFLPGAWALRGSEVALHEYVGLLALSMGLQ